jgi:hypothetical protein
LLFGWTIEFVFLLPSLLNKQVVSHAKNERKQQDLLIAVCLLPATEKFSSPYSWEF